MRQLVEQLVQQGEWLISAPLLFVVAWNRFNTPPTNRSGTTFALFFSGVIFYYALTIALWILVIIALRQGSIGLDKIGPLANLNLKAQGEMDQYAPIVAALIIVVASQFRQVRQIDTAARSFCTKLAAIPSEADRLALELAQGADFQPPSEQLERQVAQLITANIGEHAVSFSSDGTIGARFTRAVALYWLFNGPRNNGTRPNFPMNAHSKSAYARILQLGEATAVRADARYEELMHVGLAYFTSPHPTGHLKDALNRAITEVSTLVCSLIARYVLYCDVTRNGRRQRLSSMGFDASHPMPYFGLDQWAATIFAVVLVSVGMMAWMPGMRPLAGGQILTIAITFGLSIGFAVMGAVVVAQRFIERRQGDKLAFPPIAELMLAALIVAGLSMALRIGILLLPALIEGGDLQDATTQFWERLPGVITPFVCTISLGILCSYMDSLNWSWLRVAAVGALGNGLAFMGAGLPVGRLLSDQLLAKIYLEPEQARYLIVERSGMIGAVIGAIVLAVFRRSERVRKDLAESAAGPQRAGIALSYIPHPAEDLEIPPPFASGDAPRNLGGYSRSNVEELEGRYVCFRPAFAAPGVISAYMVVLRWDEAQSCLTFEELERADATHTQAGRVYIPDGRPFLSLVTVEKGAIRLIMVCRPQKQQPACGLIATLSNPAGVQFTPASAPIVLKRVTSEIPQLGYIQPGSPGYETYRQELETVIPQYGLFAKAPAPASETASLLAKSAQDVRLTVVRSKNPEPQAT